MKRIYCCAYYAGVTLADCPLIARHDMVIMSLYTGRFNNLAILAEIKRLNPTIKILIYLQCAAQDLQETVPALELQKAGPEAWLPDQVYAGPPDRLFSNYRSPAWQSGMVAAVDAMYAATPLVDGPFLDNVSVWKQHVRKPGDGPIMARALQATLSEMRRRHPDKIIIGNSDSRWTDLNGEMNEGRAPDGTPLKDPTKLWPLLNQDRRHVEPEMRLALVYTKSSAQVTTLYRKAKEQGLWFCAAADPTLQTVQWWNAYDSR